MKLKLGFAKKTEENKNSKVNPASPPLNAPGGNDVPPQYLQNRGANPFPSIYGRPNPRGPPILNYNYPNGFPPPSLNCRMPVRYPNFPTRYATNHAYRRSHRMRATRRRCYPRPTIRIVEYDSCSSLSTCSTASSCSTCRRRARSYRKPDRTRQQPQQIVLLPTQCQPPQVIKNGLQGQLLQTILPSIQQKSQAIVLNPNILLETINNNKSVILPSNLTQIEQPQRIQYITTTNLQA